MRRLITWFVDNPVAANLLMAILLLGGFATLLTVRQEEFPSVDLDAIQKGDRPPTPRAIRAALPRGWALAEDNEHAYRDARLLFREGWILVVGLVVFGGLVAVLFWQTFPNGWRGVLRLAGLMVLVLLAGGVVGPMVTRALNRGVRSKRSR